MTTTTAALPSTSVQSNCNWRGTFARQTASEAPGTFFGDVYSATYLDEGSPADACICNCLNEPTCVGVSYSVSTRFCILSTAANEPSGGLDDIFELYKRV